MKENGRVRRFSGMGVRCRALIVIASALLVGCDPVSSNDDVGVRLAGGSLIEVIYVVCDGDPAAKVELWQTNGPIVGDSDDEALWRITSRDSRNVDTFVVGEVPPGFTERIPLTSSEFPEAKLAVDIESQLEAGSVVGFHFSDLRVDQVFAAGRYWTESEFRDEMSKDCPDT